MENAYSDKLVQALPATCATTNESSKARIGRALRRIWAKRLKWTRLKEKFYLKWAESIAEAARSGGDDQQELDWDSYDKIKAEIANRQLQWAADKAKAKELAKLRAERAAKARAEKMERLAQKRKERDLKAKAREQTQKKIQRKSKEEKEELAISKELRWGIFDGSFMVDLLCHTMIHKKKSMDSKISMQKNMVNGHHLTIEKLDLEFIRREKMRRKVLLADQIRAAKSKRVECVAGEAVTNSLVHPP
ncbi:PREDICTED: stress response protein NST1-like [Nelumbo nucifera]|uniref:Stress response protein NST1-like n=1 Tax=Nelumbo nucifera TaxID=4432 RepID=A0A1U7Z942_NELNU|nr:PREDICTED: stress response protein NST1-like [Nelumbo nucifera]